MFLVLQLPGAGITGTPLIDSTFGSSTMSHVSPNHYLSLVVLEKIIKNVAGTDSNIYTWKQTQTVWYIQHHPLRYADRDDDFVDSPEHYLWCGLCVVNSLSNNGGMPESVDDQFWSQRNFFHWGVGFRETTLCCKLLPMMRSVSLFFFLTDVYFGNHLTHWN